MNEQSVFAFFFDRENAEAAVLSLRSCAVSDDDLIISPAAAAQAGHMPAHVRRFWASFDGLFNSSRDRRLCAEGIRRGYAMVVAQVQTADVGSVTALLVRHGAADPDRCDAAWRADGWSGGPAAFEARDQIGLGPQCTGNVARQVEIDRAAASVLAAASAQGAYRSHTAQNPALLGEATLGQAADGERPLNAGTSAEGATAGSNQMMKLDDEHGGWSRDARLPERASSMQCAKGLAVVCSDGQHVGTIEEVEGTTMRVRSSGLTSERMIRLISTTVIHSIDDRVVLKISLADVISRCVMG